MSWFGYVWIVILVIIYAAWTVKWWKDAKQALEERKECKDCKFFEYDSIAKVDGIPLIVAHEICTKWGEGCKTSEHGYCFMLEAKDCDNCKYKNDEPMKGVYGFGYGMSSICGGCIRGLGSTDNWDPIEVKDGDDNEGQ